LEERDFAFPPAIWPIAHHAMCSDYSGLAVPPAAASSTWLDHPRAHVAVARQLLHGANVAAAARGWQTSGEAYELHFLDQELLLFRRALTRGALIDAIEAAHFNTVEISRA
jgi:hypothetical protein